MVDETPVQRRKSQQPQQRTSILLKENDDDDDDNDDDKYEKFSKQQQNKNLQESFTIKRVFASFQETAALSINANRVDAFLAAFGCAGSLVLLQILTLRVGPNYEVNGPFLTSSAMKFFLNETPGSLDACIQSSVIAILLGISLSFAPSYFDAYAKEFFLFCMLFYWKLSGSLWGAASALTMVVAVQSGGWASLIPSVQDLLKGLNQWWANNSSSSSSNNNDDHKFPWHFIFFPYISGHLILYALAFAMSILRQKIRCRLIQREFFGSKQVANEIQNLRRNSIVSGNERRERLRNLFQRMDTSGDGRLDALELQVALRAATGNEISLDDATAILNSVDSDGSGKLDFDEFCASVEKLWCFDY